MTDGGITALDPNNNVVAFSNEEDANDVISFSSSDAPLPAFGGCQTSNPDIFNLAVNGIDDQFSLCNNPGGQQVLVFAATTGNPDYDGTTCQAVTVTINPE
ncbi:hypothetical protein EI94DRAFT_1707875 [Lactarius quietus]|nr:hypothetical protein EI94DRAFT_1707875 [Lactarius quietus]